MPTINSAATVYDDAHPTDARLIARAMSLHEQFMKARPTASLPTRADVMRDSREGDAEVHMFDEHDVLVARYRWDSQTDNVRKVVSHNQ